MFSLSQFNNFKSSNAMRVSFTQPKKDGFKSSYRKESGFCQGYKAFAIQDGKLIELLDLRLYCPGSVVYAALWVRCNNFAQGTGKAGGYGYHKASAAAEGAFLAAGYSFSESWGGSGNSAVIEAITAACALHGFESVHVVTMHP